MTPTDTQLGTLASDSLALPQVLRVAWHRVDAWYRTGNPAPQPELACWRLHPEAQIRDLVADFRKGSWCPTPWRQVPYPKKGGCLRHFLQPTVRDQVAFMAHVVLLGPLLDSHLESFVFGNRLYRPIIWDQRPKHPKWIHRAYPFHTTKTYQPYAQSHGLFRRAANWTVAQMTAASIPTENYSGRVQTPDDYDNHFLPRWTRPDWWKGSPDDRRALWCAIDIQLAYPSVSLKHLRIQILKMLDDHPDVEGLSDFPSFVTERLSQLSTRQQIATSLANALEAIDVNDCEIPKDSWKPKHALATLPPHNNGIPTGLAISGFLLNIALHASDQSIFAYLKKSRAENHRSAFLRFADDMILLSQSIEDLFELIESVWKFISIDPNASICRAKSKTNLYLNLTKFEPKIVQDIVRDFLKNNGWKKCKHCGQLKPGKNMSETPTLKEWWQRKVSSKRLKKFQDRISRATVGPGDVGPFVTTLVERLSAVGRDTLTERFGEGASERLIRLHDLARFDIADEQVRADTRRTFAVNRLVSAWLPNNPTEAQKAITDIRSSISFVLRQTPWKLSLWRAVVRAAARRPSPSNGSANDVEAKQWLESQLRHVADVHPEEPTSSSWLQTWPEEEFGSGHRRDSRWCDLYLSYLRGSFWQALAETLLLLWRHHDRIDRPIAGDSGPSPRWWSVRAIPEGHHSQVAKFLGDIDQWTSILYPDRKNDINLSNRPWELDQIIVAVLASRQRTDLANALRQSARFRSDQVLMVPYGLKWSKDSRTLALIDSAGRLQEKQLPPRTLDTVSLAHIQLGSPDPHLGRNLFDPSNSERSLDRSLTPMHLIASSVSLECSESVSTEILHQSIPALEKSVQAFRDDPLLLAEYDRARRILLGREDQR